MSSVKHKALGVLRRFGIEYMPDWRQGDVVLGRHLRHVFQLHDVKTVIDVGANSGQFVEFLRKHVEYAGKIHSFEPTPELAAALRGRARGDAQWAIHECALGESEETVDLHVTAHSELSSLLFPVDDDELPSHVYNGLTSVERTVPVAMRRLDNVLDEECGARGAGGLYIKVDTQGFDLPVLRGTGCWLDVAVGVQTELSFRQLYAGAAGYREVVGFLEGRGFALSGVFPVALDPQLALIEADGVFVRALGRKEGGHE